MKNTILLFLFLFLLLAGISHAQESFGPDLEQYPYPFTVGFFKAKVQRQEVQIAYMDLRPVTANGKTVILFHGKNFPGAYWEQTAKVLQAAGYRTVIFDALGFGKSSKPVVQYSFALLASIDKQILDSLDIHKVMVIGHSMGGMLAARFTLSYPQLVEKLVLEDPLGLEDWREKGASILPVDVLFAGEKKATYQSILKYHQSNYYPQWKPEYKHWVKVQASFIQSKGFDNYAFVSALTTDMIMSQPVLYEFPFIKCPTLVVVGKEDKTKVARVAPDSVLQQLGNYKQLGKKTAAAIPGAKLIEYDHVGHIPHLEIPARFHKDLIDFLGEK
jgi:pimeloyl-ACP methyl ester carboxylesterase